MQRLASSEFIFSLEVIRFYCLNFQHSNIFILKYTPFHKAIFPFNLTYFLVIVAFVHISQANLFFHLT